MGGALFLGRVDDSANGQHAATRLMVDDEDEGSVDGQSRRKSGEHAACSDIIAGLVNGYDGFMINLKTEKRKCVFNRKCFTIKDKTDIK